jgi:hypothetical protein
MPKTLALQRHTRPTYFQAAMTLICVFSAPAVAVLIEPGATWQAMSLDVGDTPPVLGLSMQESQV